MEEVKETKQEVTPEPVEAVPVKEPETTKPARTYTEEEYKGLQRKYNQLERKAKVTDEIVNTLERVTGLESKLEGMESTLSLMAEAISNRENDELLGEKRAEEPLTKRLERAKKEQEAKSQSRAQLQAQAREYQAEIAEMIADAKLDWEDDKLGKAKSLWESGKIFESVREVRRVTTKELRDTQVDIQAEVKRQLEEERRKGMKVDTATPGAGAPSFTRQQIAEMSVEEYKKHRGDILKAQAEGRVK